MKPASLALYRKYHS